MQALALIAALAMAQLDVLDRAIEQIGQAGPVGLLDDGKGD